MIGRFLGSQFSGYIAIAGVFIIIGLVVYLRNGGYQACLKDQLAGESEAQNERQKNEIEIIRLDNAALRRRYCQWVRDNVQECLEADIPILERPDDQGNDATDNSTQ